MGRPNAIAFVTLGLAACHASVGGGEQQPVTGGAGSSTGEVVASETSTGAGTPSRDGPNTTTSTSTDGGESLATGESSDSAGSEPVVAGTIEFEVVLTAAELPHCVSPGAFGPGSAWADVDGNGVLDFFAAGGNCPSTLMLGQLDGTFVAGGQLGEAAGVTATTGAVFADFDNDGWPDLYILRNGPNMLLRNSGGNTFTDVTAVAGVGNIYNASSAAFGDYDNDGDLDLYVANKLEHPDVLFRNDGDGTFVDVSSLVQPFTSYQTFGAAWLDFDNDADLDLYVVNDKEVGNQLWRNDGSGCDGWCFVDVAPLLGAWVPACGMGIAVGDVDNDGDLDLSYSDGYEHLLLGNHAAQGWLGFDDVSQAWALGFIGADWVGWGTAFLDADADAYLDLYVAGANVENVLFRNTGAGYFKNASDRCGCDDPGYSYGVSVADYDLDGRPDLLVGNRNEGHTLYRNVTDLGDHRWVEVELEGGGDINRDAVGSRVYLDLDDGSTVMAEVKAGSSVASGNSTRLHFGLGLRSILAARIRWPNGLYETMPIPQEGTLWEHAYPGA